MKQKGIFKKYLLYNFLFFILVSIILPINGNQTVHRETTSNLNEKGVISVNRTIDVSPEGKDIPIPIVDGSIVNYTKLSIHPANNTQPSDLRIFSKENEILEYPGKWGFTNLFSNGQGYVYKNDTDSIQFTVRLPTNAHVNKFTFRWLLKDPVPSINATVNIKDRPDMILWNFEKEEYSPIFIHRFSRQVKYINAFKYNNSTYVAMCINYTLYIFKYGYFDNPIYSTDHCYSYNYITVGDLNGDNVPEIIFAKSYSTWIIDIGNQHQTIINDLYGNYAVGPGGNLYIYNPGNGIYVASFNESLNYTTSELYKSSEINYAGEMKFYDGKLYISSGHKFLIFNVSSEQTIEKTLNHTILSFDILKYNNTRIIVAGTDDSRICVYSANFTLIHEKIINHYENIPIKNINMVKYVSNDVELFRVIFSVYSGVYYIETYGDLKNWTDVKLIYRTITPRINIESLTLFDIDDDGDKDILAIYPQGLLYLLEDNYKISGGLAKINVDYLNEAMESMPHVWINGMMWTYITLEFNINPENTVKIDSLNISYAYILETLLSGEIKEIKIFSSTIAEIHINFAVNYALCPPYLIKKIPDVTFYEDGTYNLDLSSYFVDDNKIAKYSVEIVNSSCVGCIHYVISGNSLFIYPEHNYFGTDTILIHAYDDYDLSTMSNPFNITVLPVDDPPEIANIPPMRIHANTTHYLNLSGKVWDIDSPHIFINTSDPENVTPLSNLSLRIRYLQPGDYNPSIIVSDGNLTNSTTLNISVYPYSAPLFLKVPDVVTDKDVPITIENAKVNLRDYVDDPDTLPSQLHFTILNQSNPHISVSIEDGFVLVTPEEHYAGISYVIVKVDDGKYNDTTRFKVIVREKNYPPVYLGGLYDQTVYEDTTWRIDLSKHFDDYETPLGLVYSCNYPEIKIIGTIAEWTPRHGSKSLIGVIFTATDDVGQSANSTPINLQYVEVNDPPQYTGGLTNITMFDNQTLQLNLSNYFTDEEHPELLKFAASNQIVRIEGHVAIIEKPAPGRYEVRFTAIDGENSSLKAYSPTITITVLPHNKKPVAYIDKAIVKGKTVFLVGHGYDPDGYIVKYEWYSSLDGYIGNTSELTVTLSPGTHIIRFRVMDNNGTWSNYTEISVTIEEKGAFEIPRIVYGLLGGTLGLLAVVNLGRRLKFRKLKKEIFEGV